VEARLALFSQSHSRCDCLLSTIVHDIMSGISKKGRDKPAISRPSISPRQVDRAIESATQILAAVGSPHPIFQRIASRSPNILPRVNDQSLSSQPVEGPLPNREARIDPPNPGASGHNPDSMNESAPIDFLALHERCGSIFWACNLEKLTTPVQELLGGSL
jgi:hypothetical protein